MRVCACVCVWVRACECVCVSCCFKKAVATRSQQLMMKQHRRSAINLNAIMMQASEHAEIVSVQKMNSTRKASSFLFSAKKYVS